MKTTTAPSSIDLNTLATVTGGAAWQAAPKAGANWNQWNGATAGTWTQPSAQWTNNWNR